MAYIHIIRFILCCNLFTFALSQSALSVDFDNSLCLCDLTPNSCDLNCCCDTTCTDAIKLQFSGCYTNNIVTNDRVCSYNSITYDPVTRNPINRRINSKNGFCVYNNNYFQSSFYTTQNTISNAADLNRNIAAYSLPVTVNTPASPTQNIPLNNTEQFPTGFILSGNIGYEMGKPVMRAVLNNQLITIATDSSQWWSLKSGDNCDTSTSTESVNFGTNIFTGCSLVTNATCQVLQEKSNRYLEAESNLDQYRIASFAKINVTNLNNWVSIVTTNNQPSGTGCNILTTRTYEIAYSRIGRTTYTHNKIIGVRASSQFSTVSENSNTNVMLKTVVNFIDTTQPSLVASKLSPFLTIKLPFDFFYPIYMT